MTTQPLQPTFDQRIRHLFDHLGIKRAHFAAHMPDDWQPLARSAPELIASLTLICPTGGERDALELLGARTTLVNGTGQ